MMSMSLFIGVEFLNVKFDECAQHNKKAPVSATLLTKDLLWTQQYDVFPKF